MCKLNMFNDIHDLFFYILVIHSLMFSLSVFKYATTHWFCLDPALWASFLEPISMGAFTNWHLFDFRRKFCDPLLYFHWWSACRFPNLQKTHGFCLDPALPASFLEPISMGTFTKLHFFDFRRKFCDPSCYFDDLISVFAKSYKNQGSEKSWKFSRPLWRSPNCFF